LLKRSKIVEWMGNTFSSTFERDYAQQLEELGLEWDYEKFGVRWLPKPRVYTPDFRLMKLDGEFMFIETKGYFDGEDRSKMAAIKKQYPDMDIRLVFMLPNKKLSKAASAKTYAQWAEQHGFKWSSFCIPTEWRDLCDKKMV